MLSVGTGGSQWSTSGGALSAYTRLIALRIDNRFRYFDGMQVGLGVFEFKWRLIPVTTAVTTVSVSVIDPAVGLTIAVMRVATVMVGLIIIGIAVVDATVVSLIVVARSIGVRSMTVVGLVAAIVAGVVAITNWATTWRRGLAHGNRN